ncbi:MAG: hypothetical protein C4342_00465 [Armatimonadota bacterium]
MGMRIVRWVLLLAVLVGVGWVYKTVSGVAGNASPATLFRIVQQPRDFFLGKERVNVLIVGKDYNRDARGMPYTKNARADTVMLLSLDLARRQAAAVSVPRDTYVVAPDGVGGKINGTFSRGGVELLKQTLERTFDLTIDHHVVIKDTAIKNIVDALGGVWVETIDEMHYDDNWGGLHIHLPKGRQFINGEQAVGFVRFREVNTYKLDRWGNRVPIYPPHRAPAAARALHRPAGHHPAKPAAPRGHRRRGVPRGRDRPLQAPDPGPGGALRALGAERPAEHHPPGARGLLRRGLLL